MQFGSLEEFQQEFRDINQEEQVGRLHKMLAPHLLRSKFCQKKDTPAFKNFHSSFSSISIGMCYCCRGRMEYPHSYYISTCFPIIFCLLVLFRAYGCFLGYHWLLGFCTASFFCLYGRLSFFDSVMESLAWMGFLFLNDFCVLC